MKRLIVWFLATIGALTLVLLLALFWVGRQLILPRQVVNRDIPDHAILSLHIGEYDLPEHYRYGGIIPVVMGEPRNTFKDLLIALHQATYDPRIKGVLLNIEGNQFGFAKSQELREALKKFKSKGKFVYAFAETFGELSGGTTAYYIAAVADKIWIQPLGFLGLTGLSMEVPFVKNLLDDYQVHPQIDKRSDYKSAPNTYLEAGFTDKQRENMETLLQDLMGQILEDVAEDRGIKKLHLSQLVEKGPYSPKQAEENGLIDHIGYLDDVKTQIQKRLGKSGIYYTITAYLNRLQPPKEALKHKLALIYLEGEIYRKQRDDGELTGEMELGDEKIAKAIRQAVRDKEIKAIILRLNSPGGSPAASETIRHEVEQAIKQGKHVVVSMGDVVASGGYLIACSASKIVAERGTITGSIGVFGGKMVFGDLFRDFGINWEAVRTHPNSSMWSSNFTYTKEGWAKVQEWLDEVYEEFKQRVAKGRDLSLEQVEQIAKGRVYTGQEAQEKGLVDEIGGIHTAVKIAKKLAGLDPKEAALLVEFPKKKTFSEKFMELLQENDQDFTVQAPMAKLYYRFSKVLGPLEKMMNRSILEAPQMPLKS